MNDSEKIRRLYDEMYTAMISKNEMELNKIHDDSFVLVHMTGRCQDKSEYIGAIVDGTLNYYSEKTEKVDIDISGDTAVMTGDSVVGAAVFGGSRHIWRLTLRLNLKKVNGEWKLTKAQASTW